VTPDDVAEIAPSVLAHRLVLTPDAELERFTGRDAVRSAIADVPVPR
jgi:MoxR-like ATPase